MAAHADVGDVFSADGAAAVAEFTCVVVGLGVDSDVVAFPLCEGNVLKCVVAALTEVECVTAAVVLQF